MSNFGRFSVVYWYYEKLTRSGKNAVGFFIGVAVYVSGGAVSVLKREEEHAAARAEYITRRSKGEKVNLKELAARLGVAYQTLRNWKRDGKWDGALPPKKRGGQPGNQNSKGHKNASGNHSGAPPRNKNAEKHGAYSSVFFDMLSDSEKELLEKVPLGGRDALEHEMRILKIREHRILEQIARYENASEDSLYINSVLDMRKPQRGQDGAIQDMGMYTKDSAFSRVLKLQEALYKVQGRIAKIADGLRALEENERRMQLEQQRLEIMRMRATGEVVDPDIEDLDSSGEFKGDVDS